MKKLLVIIILAMCGMTFYAIQANAADAATIKKNMAARLPQIDALKAKGLIGENNNGYLGVVGAALSDADAKIVNTENDERKIVYTAISKQQKTTLELVGQRRALQNIANAKTGTFVMTEPGKWSKK